MQGDLQSDEFMASMLAEDGSISDTETESAGSEAAANKSISSFRKNYLKN
jgi:hypothetical protein